MRGPVIFVVVFIIAYMILMTWMGQGPEIFEHWIDDGNG